jgi:cyclopropane fatty-acyl-phospholipid synthase-like methyltransferase
VGLDDEELGPAIMFPNPEIRRMLNLAAVGPKDIFYDVGCGWAQNLIIALTEFDVKKAIGLENDSSRYEVASKRIKQLGLTKRCNIIKADLEKARCAACSYYAA